MSLYNEEIKVENEKYLIRNVLIEDCNSLLKVYSDKNALPFFNSDNCDGDNFYYETEEKILNAYKFWKIARENDWFLRLSIVDKENYKVIGTIEICVRSSNDCYNDAVILRVDVLSDYELNFELESIFSLSEKIILRLFNEKKIITKAPLYAVERRQALFKLGYCESLMPLEGKKRSYYNYWIK